MTPSSDEFLGESAETAAFAVRERVKANLASVRARIGEALRRAGRPKREARLVAVTKYASLQECVALHDAGQRVFAESRLPACLDKMDALPRDIEWHLIGHLQRNKAKLAPGRFALVHSLDSVRLMESLAKLAQERRVPVRGLLEFNPAEEPQKHGFLPAERADALAAALRLAPDLRIEGLMGMAPASDGPEKSRPAFATLREIRDALRADSGGKLGLPELSMGMSGDFEIAIEEGATLVRVGSALFE